MTHRSDTSFSRQMRAATKDSHDISDALVNAKLAFALTDDTVWADGLLIFYEIFKYLEHNASQDILPKEFHRTEFFEKDLSYFLGSDWKSSYKPRKSVLEYLDHLRAVKKENPILLLAYVYHLYMGLLSGAQILRKKRALALKLNPLSSSKRGSAGAEVTHFEGFTVTELKKKMREILEQTASNFDEETKKRMFEESSKVFELNNKIVRTVKNVNRVNFKKLLMITLFGLITFMMYKVFFP